MEGNSLEKKNLSNLFVLQYEKVKANVFLPLLGWSTED